ncbi:rhodanese-related sulfurtransferase [Synechococcus sp. CS-1324]|uniref:oxygen-dependent tRNA uridine(34) hydroxylase TrhO n=1 Tax=Synechococcus sp. CS-1324 TaxID=2847980 RepID=UPI000DB4BD9F|nr:rhodanese-related sulfurtransferase [Synechococcus sp. CS-1324]MCT0229606.1 rhodanese-related sulfurtransferase [Synechococcus sp. CS-1324]PZV02861.1 MAG: hypothetical protein DCF23_10985 [Cyanobium sp.]
MGAEPAAFQVASFYRFVPLDSDGLEVLQRGIRERGAAGQLSGTVLLAEEGLNGTVCGPAAGVADLLAWLQAQPGLADLEVKTSWSAEPGFHRLKVRRKREIVTLGCPTVRPLDGAGSRVPPQQWNALVDDPDTLVIDARNGYEVAVGTFAGALDPGIERFGAFPAWVERELRPRVAAQQPRRLALFCTGGIRCEKATAYLLQQGFEGVHQLQGGILRYLEEIPEAESRWSGECFVFDHRVALDHRLQPGSHSLCHACGLPLSPGGRQQAGFEAGVSCHHCIARFSDADRGRFAERQRQIGLARQRGQAHLGLPSP